MELSEGIKLSGKPVEIPECSRDGLPEFFKGLGFKIGAEIGVHKGKFTEKFCKAGIHMYAIDPWKAYLGAGRGLAKQEVQDEVFNEALARLGQYDNCTMIRHTSVHSLRYVARDSLDFVYIDGDHSLRPVIDDILGWNRKVRSGGIISGHDYFCSWSGATNTICHVEPAVNACIQVLGIENFWIFGKPYLADQYCYSWMWIKP